MSEKKKEQDPLVVEGESAREIFRKERERSRLKRAEASQTAMAEAKKAYDELQEKSKKKNRRDQAMGGTVQTGKKIPPPLEK